MSSGFDLAKKASMSTGRRTTFWLVLNGILITVTYPNGRGAGNTPAFPNYAQLRIVFVISSALETGRICRITTLGRTTDDGCSQRLFLTELQNPTLELAQSLTAGDLTPMTQSPLIIIPTNILGGEGTRTANRNVTIMSQATSSILYKIKSGKTGK